MMVVSEALGHFYIHIHNYMGPKVGKHHAHQHHLYEEWQQRELDRTFVLMAQQEPYGLDDC